MESIIIMRPPLLLGTVPNSRLCSASHSINSSSSLFLHSNASSSAAFSSVTHHSPKCFLSQLHKAKKKKQIHAASEGESPTANASEKWLLEPVGDGDSRHIGFKVEMPGAYELASSVVTVGRTPEKADLVIPVATVSAVHARIQKKQDNLLVTDLDSTNGTFIDDKRLRPGVVATVFPGNCITFGDTHLAMFRVSKVEEVTTTVTTEETEAKQDTDKEPN